ncbi:MAG: tetraacyldisaccharide 4'-kinase [Phycisphaerales bacterium]
MSGGEVSKQRPHDTLRRLVGPIAAPLYGAIVGFRNARFDRGVGVKRVAGGVPVVSVGNLTVGGTGKTPFVMWLCRELLSRGLKPAIAMRGYKSEANQGRSDEAEEYRAALPQVPVIVNPDRFAGISAFLSGGGVADVVVLDDGFQHRRLHRDLDVVLVDARADTPHDRLLPWGDLRERVAGVKRAGVVVLTHAENVEAASRTEAALRSLPADGAIVARAEHRWDGFDVNDAGNELSWKTEYLRKKRVIAVCGIARPAGFFQRLKELGCDVAGEFVLADHQPIDAALAQAVADSAAKHRAQFVVTTQKDFARLGRVPVEWETLTVVRPRVAMDVRPAEAVIERVLGAIRAARTSDLPA